MDEEVYEPEKASIQEEANAQTLYDTKYRPKLLNDARKVIKRRTLKRILMSPEKLPSKKEDSNFKRIKPGKIFAFHFLLAWTENGYLFSYLNSLNFGTGSSILDLSFVSNLNEYIIIHLTYLIGLLFGCLFFSYLYNNAFIKFYFKIFKIRYMDDAFDKKMKKLLPRKKSRFPKQAKFKASDFYFPIKTVKKREKKLDTSRLPLILTPEVMRYFKRTKTLRFKKQRTFIDKGFVNEKLTKEEIAKLEIPEPKILTKARRFYRRVIEFTDTFANMNSIYFSRFAKYYEFDREVKLKEKIHKNFLKYFEKYFNDEFKLFRTVFKQKKEIVYLGSAKKKQKDKKEEPFSKKINVITLISFKIIKKLTKLGIKSLRKLIIKDFYSLIRLNLNRLKSLIWSIPKNLKSLIWSILKNLKSLIWSIPKNLKFFINFVLTKLKDIVFFSFSQMKKVFKKSTNEHKSTEEQNSADLRNSNEKDKTETILSTPNLLEMGPEDDTPIFIGRKLIIRRITTILFTLIVGITMSSLSYYDVSYLLTRPLGFIPQDQRISRTIMNSNSDDVCEYGLSNDRDLYQMMDNNFLYSDIMSIDSKEYKNGLTYEQVNYQAEYSWASRSDPMKRTGFKFFENQVRKQPKFRDNICVSEKDIYLAELEYDEIEELLTRDFSEKREYVDPILTRIYAPPQVYFDINPYGDNTKYHYRDEIDTHFKIEFLPIDLDSELFQWDEEDYLVEGEIGEEVKQTYYQNYLYKMLLNGEIDAFISRQPTDFILSEFEENELFLRRKAISNYYESNFYYSKINHFDAFRNIFFDSKSALNTTYNQQFKGTLNIVQRLFPISLDNNNIRSVLKYDLPLIKKTNYDHFSHEELLNNGKNLSSNYKGLLSTTASPLFIKWNNQLNQLVMTNNLILKDTKNLDIYDLSSPFKREYLFDSLNMLNLQKFTSLIRNSYSIIQCPSLALLGSSPDSTSKLDYLLEKFDMPLEETTQAFFRKIGIQPNPDLRLLNSWINRFNWYSFRYMDTLPFKDQTEEFADIEHAIKSLYYRDNIKGQQLEYRYRKGINQFRKINDFISDETYKNKMNERIKNYLVEDENINDEDQLSLLLFFGEIFDDPT